MQSSQNRTGGRWHCFVRNAVLAAVGLSAVAGTTAHAQIGIQDSAGGINSAFNATTYTQSATVSEGKDRILVVSIHTRNPVNPSSVTYGGVALTYASNSRATGGDGGNGVRTQFYYLLDPPVGTANLTVSFSTAPWKVGMRRVVLTGAKQQGPEAVATAGVIGTSVSATTTTLSPDAMLVSAATHYDAVTVTPTAPLIQRGSSNSSISIRIGSLLTGSAGEYTTEWTASASQRFSQSVIAFAPALPSATLITIRLPLD